jgi:trimeric autotransporter adhesin
MQFAKSLLLSSTLILLVSAAMNAQQAANSSSSTVVPRLVNFSAKATDAQGKPIAGIAGITFSIYKDQYEGAPLWMETQNVNADTKGNYTVQLGATSTQGLPLDLFTSGEARWLGVRVNVGEEQPRVLLLSVPYALKAADAQTLGGLPSSAFVLAGAASASAPQATVSTSNPGKLAAGNTSAANSLTIGGSGTAGRIPLWTTSTNLGNSALFQIGTGTTAKVGLGTTTPGAPLDVHGIINSSAGFNLAGKPFAFGSFTNDNAFLGFAGNTTMTGTGNTAIGAFSFVSNTNGFNNTATGFTALQHNTTGCCNTAIGSAALQDDTTGFSNTATGYEALEANSSGNSNTANGQSALQQNTAGINNTALGAQALESNTDGSFNTASGSAALESNIHGTLNTAIGYEALMSNTGINNTATGAVALVNNTTGTNNTAVGEGALGHNTAGESNTATGSQALINSTASGNTATGYEALENTTAGGTNTAIGYSALMSNTTGNFNTAAGGVSGLTVDGSPVTGSDDTFLGFGAVMSTGSLSNATAIGAGAVVSVSGALVLGKTNTNVGIGTTAPSNVFTIGKGAGHAIADGWNTYSSRRWKTNIHPLENALSKVEKLRGVSYELKDSGKHEIGVIAEEVGQVVPEVVSYEKNGKDAKGVDYSRLTALLIEAVKQQQTQIVAQQKQIALQQSQLRKQQRFTKAQQLEISTLRHLMTTQQNEVAELSHKVDFLEPSVRTSHEQTATVLASQ